MRRWQGLVALALGATIVGGGAVSANTTNATTSAQSPGLLASARHGAASVARFVGLDDEQPVAPGTLDDGKELLPQAGISLEQAVAAAQTAATGDIGEVDLEHFQGKLVFNVDVGDHDVKVDASDGTVLNASRDD
ncbi:MAG: Peptidase propeptide and domain [Thermomicrobiales bacterium]|jgi:uncharacterized membrane protein YkoI|nr:Peptidase propeptide and domain [Thermomicrobiales bacterium]